MPQPPEPATTASPTPIPAPAIARRWYTRWLLRALAVTSLGLGIAGVFIPGLPTTVFILIASWAAMRSSPRLHVWLWQHRLFGPMLQNWAAGGYVSRRAKYSAAAMMALCAIILWIAPAPCGHRCWPAAAWRWCWSGYGCAPSLSERIPLHFFCKLGKQSKIHVYNLGLVPR